MKFKNNRRAYVENKRNFVEALEQEALALIYLQPLKQDY